MSENTVFVSVIGLIVVAWIAGAAFENFGKKSEEDIYKKSHITCVENIQYIVTADGKGLIKLF